MAYENDHISQGIALVIVNENFQASTGRSYRPGASRDADALCATMQSAGFTVLSHKDLTSAQMMETAREVAQKHVGSECGCLLVAISSHGTSKEFHEDDHGVDVDFYNEVDMLYGTDAPLPIKKLTTIFSEENCPNLKDKPKLFFLQGCGDYEDEETATNDASSPQVSSSATAPPVPIAGTRATRSEGEMSPSAECSETVDSLLSMSFDDKEDMKDINGDSGIGVEVPMPMQKIVSTKAIIAKDYLIMWSCQPGYHAFHTEKGSPFLQILCEVLSARFEEEDLLAMLTEVYSRVSAEYESRTGPADNNNRHLVPSIEHMLPSSFYLSAGKEGRSSPRRQLAKSNASI